jgi:hypothetical protein
MRPAEARASATIWSNCADAFDPQHQRVDHQQRRDQRAEIEPALPDQPGTIAEHPGMAERDHRLRQRYAARGMGDRGAGLAAEGGDMRVEARDPGVLQPERLDHADAVDAFGQVLSDRVIGRADPPIEQHQRVGLRGEQGDPGDHQRQRHDPQPQRVPGEQETEISTTTRSRTSAARN